MSGVPVVNVAYLWSDFPEMPRLARRLEETIGWHPVLWLGHAHLQQGVCEAFPQTAWQTISDAWFGLPIEGVNSAQPYALDAEWWTRLQPYLPRLMNQMNRFGPADYFLYDEREAFARNLLLRWHEALTATAVQVAFFEESPSVPFSYAAYAVCCELDIPTVSLVPTKVFDLSLLREKIEAPPLRIGEEYVHRLEAGEDVVLTPEAAEAIAGVRGHADFRHLNEMALAERERQTRAELEVLQGLVRDDHASPATRLALRTRWFATKALHAFNVLKWPLFVSNAFKTIRARRARAHALWKAPDQPIDAGVWTGARVRRYWKDAARMKRQLRLDYERRCEHPDFANDRYVYFPLHYRPERTSNPDGGVFYDQIIPLMMVSAALPDGWKLYVKEHGVQFNTTMSGECGRTPAYYDQIARLRGVKFIPHETPSKDLVLHAQAVASITGTVCWEAALLGKPGMHFGYPWYESCPGTVRVGSESDVRAVLSNLQEHTATEAQTEAWHAALDDAGCHFEFNAWQRFPGALSAETQLQGLASALEWWHTTITEIPED
jgi:hypothetical protein